jgi:hypothetical protein
MGRQPPTGYVERREVAELLNISLTKVGHLVRRRLLVPHQFDRIRGVFFKEDAVHFLKLSQSDREPDLQEVHSMALAAASSAQRAEQRLNELYARLGLDLEPIQRDPAAIRALYASAQQGPSERDAHDPEWLRLWGRSFFSMDELYLELVERVTGDAEPWKVFMDFASAVASMMTTELRAVLGHADKLFQAGRDHLRYVSYMHCRRTRGQTVATQIFDGRPGAVEELYAILF